MEEEMRLHLELETERYLRQGQSPVEARRRARLSFGAMEAVKEAHLYESVGQRTGNPS